MRRGRIALLSLIFILAVIAIVFFIDDYFNSPLGTVSEGQQLTEQENAEVMRIALSDPRVQAEIRGTNYTISGVGTYGDEWAGFRRAYPEVQFIMYDQHRWIGVIVDQRHGKVREIWHDIIPVVPQNVPGA